MIELFAEALGILVKEEKDKLIKMILDRLDKILTYEEWGYAEEAQVKVLYKDLVEMLNK